MIYQDAEQRIGDLFQLFSQPNSAFRMAKVIELSAGRPKIQFYGETQAAKKLYKYLSGYSAQVGDVVLMARTGNTYVILGKVT